MLKLRTVGINRISLDLEKDVEKIVGIYRALLDEKSISASKRGYTKGHWEKGVE